MRRREFITLLGGATTWPLAGRAQQPSVPVIEFLRNTSAENSAALVAAFREGLKEADYVEGQNVVIEYRWAEGEINRLPALVSDLIRRPVDVIVTGGTDATQAAKAATSKIPIVFASGDDPIRLGLVTSLNQPDSNLTGASFLSASALARKRVEFLHTLAPKVASIGFLGNPTAPANVFDMQETRAGAEAFGLQFHPADASDESALEPAIASLVQQRIEGLVVGGDPLFFNQRKQIAALALGDRLPTAYPLREYAAAGGFMSYGPSIADAFHQAGVYAGRILKGAKPAELPVVLPTKFDLVINLKTAKALGLEVPPQVIALADEVIE